MQKLNSPYNPHRMFALCLIGVMGALIALTISGYGDGRFVELDEYRAISFELDHTALFRLIYSWIGGLAGSSHDRYLRISGSCWALSLLLGFLVGQKVTGKRIGGVVSAAALSVSITHGWYARSAYPVALAAMLLVAMVYVWALSQPQNRIRYVFLSIGGALGAVLLLSYLAWYPVVAAVFVGMVLIPYSTSKAFFREILFRAICVAVSCASMYLLGAYLLSTAKGESAFDWFAMLAAVQRWGVTFVTEDPLASAFGQLGAVLWKEALFGVGVIAILLSSRQRRAAMPTVDSFPVAVVVVAFLGIVISFTPAALGLNTLYERNLVGQMLLLQLGLGMVLSIVYRSLERHEQRKLGVLVVLVMVLASFNFAVHRRELLRIDPILSWLRAQGSSPGEVVTILDIARNSQESAVWLPHHQIPISSRPRVIDWAQFDKLIHDNPQLKYLLLTDFYMLKLSGKPEVQIWNKATPAAVFSHPVTGARGIRAYRIDELAR